MPSKGIEILLMQVSGGLIAEVGQIGQCWLPITISAVLFILLVGMGVVLWVALAVLAEVTDETEFWR